MHHERLDGSGYHDGVSAGAIPMNARILAAADTFQTATQARPAVVDAAGQLAAPAWTSWPAGLTDREVEVLRLVARGLSNKQIANELVISRRTAEHHVQHIHRKIGTSTRAAASLFAMEHDLLRGWRPTQRHSRG